MSISIFCQITVWCCCIWLVFTLDVCMVFAFWLCVCKAASVVLPFRLFLLVSLSCALIDPHFMNIHALVIIAALIQEVSGMIKKTPWAPRPILNHCYKQIITKSPNLPAQKWMCVLSRRDSGWCAVHRKTLSMFKGKSSMKTMRVLWFLSPSLGWS